MIKVYKEGANTYGNVELSLVWENDSTYLLDLVARVIFGDCNDIDGYLELPNPMFTV